MLDVNFISDLKPADSYAVSLKDGSPLETLRNVVASWYVTLRTIAIVGLLSVLIYIGIRIIISSTSDKAKYKERLLDWIIAFCLLFFMHYIMAAMVTTVEKVNNMLGQATGVFDGIEINPDFGEVGFIFGTNDLGTTEGNSDFTSSSISSKATSRAQAISEAKSRASQLGAVYKSESSSWTENWIEGDSSVGGKAICTYKIVYDKYTATITERKEVEISGSVINSKSKYELTGLPATTKNKEGTTGNDWRISTEPNKVMYFTNYARLFLNAKTDSTLIGAGFTHPITGVIGAVADGSYDPSVNNENAAISTAYLIIYLGLVILTAVFTFRYIKRVIYIAFLTLIAPMVALTYPLDKIKDRKSTSLEYVV